ncbi:MAG: sigma factor [Acidobacteriota bacterium]
MNNHGCAPAAAPATGKSFHAVVLPHLETAYRLARWLMRNEHDAEDAVQDASLRAFRYVGTFTGGNGRAWCLRIVRTTCLDWHGQRVQAPSDPFDEELHSSARPASQSDPELMLLHVDNVASIERAMRTLPDRLRKLLVLCEFKAFRTANSPR